jgi:hypothetical protein
VLRHTYLALCALTLGVAMPAQYANAALVAAWTATGLVTGLCARLLGSALLRWVGLGLLLVGLGASGLLTPGHLGLLTALFASFVLVERVGGLARAGLPPPEEAGGLGALKAACAGGAGLALVWLVGARMPEGLVTLGWVVAAFGMFAVGFAVRERWYRLGGLAALALALGRLLLVDVIQLPPDQRIVTFILLGVLLLAISYTYTRLTRRS